MDDTYSLKEAAQRLRKSAKQVTRDIHAGKLPATKDGKGHWRVPVGAVEVAQNLIETVPVQRPLDRETLALVIDEAVSRHNRDLTEKIATLTQRIEALQADVRTLSEVTTPPKPVPWWRRRRGTH